MVRSSQLRREPVVDVGGVAEPGEQNYRTAGASPVEHLQLHVFIDGYKHCLGPVAVLCDQQRTSQKRQRNGAANSDRAG